MSRKAIILVSGGMDSATTLAIAKADGFDCLPLSFQYGQRHGIELAAACEVCRSKGVAAPHLVQIDLRAFGASALTADFAVPKDRDNAQMAADIPLTYVPARNTIFLAYALGAAEAWGARDIFIGVNTVDYSGYPDCRPEFIAAFERTANLGTRAGVQGDGFRIHTPLINLTKAEIILRGARLGVDYSLTHSCYDPVGSLACGRCDSCAIRRRGFEQAGLPDPTQYSQ